MTKIYGLFGAMTGKLADTVMAVRNGQQLARKYQPIVSNPSTPAQVAQRAKLKLLSQLSAVMAPVIALRRVGSVSARNIFTKVNFPSTTYTTNTASIDLEGIQLTSSVVPIPAIEATRVDTNTRVRTQAPLVGFDRMVYCAFIKGDDDSLRYDGSVVVNATGTDDQFPATFPQYLNVSVLFLGYGVRDNNENARVTFGNMDVPTAEDIAKLVVASTLTESDVTLSVTKGTTLPASSEAKEAEKKGSKK